MKKRQNYLRKIANPEIIKGLARLRCEDVWNATYSEALDDLCRKGYFITVEPFESKATKDGIAWYSKYTRTIGGRVYTEEQADSYLNWYDAVEAAMESAISNYFKSSNPEEREENCAEKSTIERSSGAIPDKMRSYAAEFYGRHTTDDPFPFE